MKPLLVFGAGGQAKSVIATIHATGRSLDLVSVDGRHDSTFLGVPVIPASKVHALRGGFRFIVAIGDCATRRAKFDWLLSLGGEPETLIHPRANVSEFVEIGRGSVVFSMAHIDPCVSIGENCIVNIGAMIGHDCIIESHTHVSGLVVLSGGTHIGEGAWIGAGTSTRELSKVGAGAYIGAGSVIVRDIPARHVAFGNPAHRQMRPIEERALP